MVHGDGLTMMMMMGVDNEELFSVLPRRVRGCLGIPCSRYGVKVKHIRKSVARVFCSAEIEQRSATWEARRLLFPDRAGCECCFKFYNLRRILSNFPFFRLQIATLPERPPGNR